MCKRITVLKCADQNFIIIFIILIIIDTLPHKLKSLAKQVLIILGIKMVNLHRQVLKLLRLLHGDFTVVR